MWSFMANPHSRAPAVLLYAPQARRPAGPVKSWFLLRADGSKPARPAGLDERRACRLPAQATKPATANSATPLSRQADRGNVEPEKAIGPTQSALSGWFGG